MTQGDGMDRMVEFLLPLVSLLEEIILGNEVQVDETTTIGNFLVCLSNLNLLIQYLQRKSTTQQLLTHVMLLLASIIRTNYCQKKLRSLKPILIGNARWVNQLNQIYSMYQHLCETACIVGIPHTFTGAVVLTDGSLTPKLPSEHPSGKM